MWEIQASLKDDVLPLNQAQRKTPSFGLNSCILGGDFGLCGKQKRPTMLTFFWNAQRAFWGIDEQESEALFRNSASELEVDLNFMPLFDNQIHNEHRFSEEK